jgi:ankyrin repeat protein
MIKLTNKKTNQTVCMHLLVRHVLLISFVLIFVQVSGCGSGSKSIFDTVKEGDTEQLRKMLEKDPALAKTPSQEVRYRGQSPLHFATSGEVVEILVEAGADVMARETVGLTPLHTTTTGEAAQALIDAGADVMAENPKGLTPLHKAENAEVAEVLIDNGAEVNYVKVPDWYEQSGSRNPLKDTPLYWAILEGRADVVRVLLEYGADPHQPLNKERTMLHHAARYSNSTDIIELLVEYIEVDASDEYNATPLHLAAVHNKLKAAEQLIQAGADLNATLDSGVTITEGFGGSQFYAGNATPLIAARTDEMRGLLKEYGATE